MDSAQVVGLLLTCRCCCLCVCHPKTSRWGRNILQSSPHLYKRTVSSFYILPLKQLPSNHFLLRFKSAHDFVLLFQSFLFLLVGFSGTPNNGTPWAPYYSHTTPIRIPWFWVAGHLEVFGATPAKVHRARDSHLAGQIPDRSSMIDGLKWRKKSLALPKHLLTL